MKTCAKLGWTLLTGMLVVPWFSLVGEETVAIQQKPVPLAGTPSGGEAQVDEEPWLGVIVSKPSMAMYAQLPKVPRGAGFVVRVSKGGPADQAGMAEADFLLKLDDQLLMNEAQFMALLDLRDVGDVVRLTYFRGGEKHEVEVTLAARPEDEKGRAQADLAALSNFIPGLPTHGTDLLNQTAFLRDSKETVRIHRVRGVYKWVVFDEYGLEMSSGELAGMEAEDFPPELNVELKGKLMALIRSLEATGHRRVTAPRVRRVPPPNDGKSQ